MGMGEGPRQLLVVLSGDGADSARCELRRRFAVTDVASPRLLLVRDAGDEAAAIEAVDGVATVLHREVPSHVLESLDEGEATFARAWEQRQRPDRKARDGEGLSWDAPGFEAPDPPG
jgi:hypothetical protein